MDKVDMSSSTDEIGKLLSIDAHNPNIFRKIV